MGLFLADAETVELGTRWGYSINCTRLYKN